MSKLHERYKTEGTAKVLKLHLQFFKTFDCFTMQVIYYFTQQNNIPRVHSSYGFCPFSRTNSGNWISFPLQVKGWRDINGVGPDRHRVILISGQATFCYLPPYMHLI